MNLSITARRTAVYWGNRFFEACCAILIAVGAVLSFDQAFRFHAEVSSIVWDVTVVILLLTLTTRRPWVFFAAAAAAMSLLAWYLLFTDGFDSFLSYWRGLLDWWVELFPKRSAYNTDENIRRVQLIIHVLAAAVIYLLVCVLRRSWAILLWSGIFLVVLSLNGFQENVPAMLCITLGTLPLAARNLYNRDFRRGVRMLSPRWQPVAAGIALCAAAALLAGAILPDDTASWRVPQLARILIDWQDSQDLPGLIDRDEVLGLLEIDMHSLGLQPETGRLGGDISLKNRTVVMRVQADDPGLMRGNVYQEYTGSEWRAGSYRGVTQYSMEGDALGSALLSDLPSGEYLRPMFESLASRQNVQVQIRRRTRRLFTSDKAFGLQGITDDVSQVSCNEAGELYTGSSVAADYRYSYETWRLDAYGPDFLETMRQLTDHAALAGDPQYDAIYAQYTALPDSLPQNVYDMAVVMAGGAHNPYEQMVNMEHYLRTNYRYTLTPGNVPRGRDFVDYFLETGEGYCVYFASAMAVMARTLGIPARFVTGYALRQEGGEWVARESTAHAWVECYFPGVGWLTFDPTGGAGYTNGHEAVITTTSTSGTTGTTTSRGDTTTTSRTTGASSSAHTTTQRSTTATTAPQDTELLRVQIPPWVWYAVLPGAAVLALLLAVLGRIWRFRICFRPDEVRRRLPKPAAQAGWYYTDLLRQLRFLHLEPGAGETMRQFVSRVNDRLAEPPSEKAIEAGRTVPDGLTDALWAVTDIMERCRYGEIEPSKDDIEALSRAHEGLELYLRRWLRAVPYFFRRMLFGW